MQPVQITRAMFVLCVMLLMMINVSLTSAASVRGASDGLTTTHTLNSDRGVPTWACAMGASPQAPLHLVAEQNRSRDLRTIHVPEAEGSVAAVDATSLQDHVSNATGNILVVFYAPWCPHCQKFVMEGPDGTQESAPLEKLKRELAHENVKVLKFDTEAHMVPAEYSVEYIPRIFKVTRNSTGTFNEAFQGDPHDFSSLKEFAVSEVQVTTPAPVASHPTLLKSVASHPAVMKFIGTFMHHVAAVFVPSWGVLPILPMLLR